MVTGTEGGATGSTPFAGSAAARIARILSIVFMANRPPCRLPAQDDIGRRRRQSVFILKWPGFGVVIKTQFWTDDDVRSGLECKTSADGGIDAWESGAIAV